MSAPVIPENSEHHLISCHLPVRQDVQAADRRPVPRPVLQFYGAVAAVHYVFPLLPLDAFCADCPQPVIGYQTAEPPVRQCVFKLILCRLYQFGNTGELILVADTLHAFGIRDTHGVEILVHIGLETVTLNGAGFIKIKEIGQKVFEGEPIIKVDQTYMLKSGLNMITMMVVTNSSDYQISLDNLESNVDLDSVMIRCIAN